MYHYGGENVKILNTNGPTNTKININVILLFHVPGHILGLQFIDCEHEWDHASCTMFPDKQKGNHNSVAT